MWLFRHVVQSKATCTVNFFSFYLLKRPAFRELRTFCSSNTCCSQNNRSLSILRSLISVDGNEVQNYEINITIRGANLLSWLTIFEVLEWNANWFSMSRTAVSVSLKVFDSVLNRYVVAIQVVLHAPREGNQLYRITISSSRTYKTDHLWQKNVVEKAWDWLLQVGRGMIFN